MKDGSKKKTRYATMFTKASPYEVAASQQVFPWLLLYMFFFPTGGITLLVEGPMWFTIPAAVLVIGIVLWIVMRLRRRAQALNTILHLEKELPWFGSEPVTVAALPARDELHRTLTAHNYEAIHLDGTNITTWHDLANAMQEQVGPMTFPADDRQKVRALLTYLAGEKPQRRVLIWHDATIAANANPAFIPSFASTWASYALSLPPGLLVFIDLQQHAEPHQPSPDETPHRGNTGPTPDRSILKHAPDGSWWKPKPGELTH